MLWLKRASLKDWVLWQLAQVCCVGLTGMCLGGMTTPDRALLVWQVWQSRGVPLNIPFWWHDSQRSAACEPVSGKPVLKWSKRVAVCAWPKAGISKHHSTIANAISQRMTPGLRSEGMVRAECMLLRCCREAVARLGVLR